MVVVTARKVVGALSAFNSVIPRAGLHWSPLSLFAWNDFSLPSRMCKYSIASCILLFYLLCVTHGSNRKWSEGKYKRQTSNEFDVLIFTQSWPLTACFAWKKHSETHSCSLPKRSEWTIHGIWPTKYNTLGPQYCNKSMPFNPNALAPLESDLKENWMDIHNGSTPYSFWKHEWDKHGTCAVAIKALNSEFVYFRQGLNFLNDYNMIDVLAKANILPGKKYMVQDMLIGIQKMLSKRGQIMCTIDNQTGESYVAEIRICFDKTLQLVDCDGILNFPTNCDRAKEIIYPSHVPRSYRVTQI